MESWDSSNTDHRFSDNSEIAKEIIVHDHQQNSNYPDTSTIHSSRSDFVLKSHQNHTIPVTISSNRSIVAVAPSSGYRTPPTNGRPLEAIRHSDSGDSIHGNERQFSILNEKSLRNNSNHYDTKYDNCTRSTNRVGGYDTITLKLKRDKRVLDFGFSISDRLYGTGVYVNKIRPNGPAELEGTLIPCMRIYKVC
jgi:trimethylamine:corrinoid methyltransferase-like protein